MRLGELGDGDRLLDADDLLVLGPLGDLGLRPLLGGLLLLAPDRHVGAVRDGRLQETPCGVTLLSPSPAGRPVPRPRFLSLETSMNSRSRPSMPGTTLSSRTSPRARGPGRRGEALPRARGRRHAADRDGRARDDHGLRGGRSACAGLAGGPARRRGLRQQARAARHRQRPGCAGARARGGGRSGLDARPLRLRPRPTASGRRQGGASSSAERLGSGRRLGVRRRPGRPAWARAGWRRGPSCAPRSPAPAWRTGAGLGFFSPEIFSNAAWAWSSSSDDEWLFTSIAERMELLDELLVGELDPVLLELLGELVNPLLRHGQPL